MLQVAGQRAGAKRDSIAAGVATLERILAQRYDWRDAGLGATRKRRRGELFGGERRRRARAASDSGRSTKKQKRHGREKMRNERRD